MFFVQLPTPGQRREYSSDKRRFRGSIKAEMRRFFAKNPTSIRRATGGIVVERSGRGGGGGGDCRRGLGGGGGGDGLHNSAAGYDCVGRALPRAVFAAVAEARRFSRKAPFSCRDRSQ